jgi:hypothetical protein
VFSTESVRNLRAAAEGDLLHGRRLEHVGATEIPEVEREPIVRADLPRWT